MISGLLLSAAIGAASPAANDAARFETLFPDWRSLNAESLAREKAAMSRGAGAPSGRSVAEAEVLGERVGRVVAEGDCAEGERIAREAGDFALVEAVRAHCRMGGAD